MKGKMKDIAELTKKELVEAMREVLNEAEEVVGSKPDITISIATSMYEREYVRPENVVWFEGLKVKFNTLAYFLAYKIEKEVKDTS